LVQGTRSLVIMPDLDLLQISSARKEADPLVILTGGGTAGHVMPNLALLPALLASSFRVEYIGSKGLEEELVTKAGIRFHRIQSGKLRRYASVENFLDLFRVAAGVLQAFILMLRLRPACVFSKGGFVAVPVAIGAWLARVPVVSHESDVSPGLANRIIARFAHMNLYAFPETARYFAGRPAKLVGIPVRREIFTGDAIRGVNFCGWNSSHESYYLPVVLFMGGSQGAKFINDLVHAALPDLLQFCRVVHLTGRGKQERDPVGSFAPQMRDRYRDFEFLNEQLPDVLAAASLVVCRSGANSIFELRAMRKPMILIPLEKGSRGDQLLNARSFKAQGEAEILLESEASVSALVRMISEQLSKRTVSSIQIVADEDRENAEALVIDEIRRAAFTARG
jgi:UDP-N-acetylglucosamine--N-acetylmuramyl-(pentapeptide) pyrophosphoryl-undecaprenol N-acetylglucosamine transferase